MQKLHEIIKANIGHGVKVFFRGCPDEAAVSGVIVDADAELLKLEYCLLKKDKTRAVTIYLRFMEIRAVKFQTPDGFDQNFQPVKE